MDLTKVVKQQHEIANKANEPCNGIVYVFRRQDCAFLASRISKVTLPSFLICTIVLLYNNLTVVIYTIDHRFGL